MLKKVSLLLVVSFLVLCYGFSSSAVEAASPVVLDTNFNDNSLSDWKLSLADNVSAEAKIKNKQLAVKILDKSISKWDIALTHSIEPLEVGARYNVQFKVRSSKSAGIYAKIGEVGGAFAEYWNNNWSPISISSEEQTVSQQFTVMRRADAEELAFHLGGELSGEVPYVVYFDDIKITKQVPTNEILGYNFDDNKIGDWKLNVGEGAKARASVFNKKLKVKICKNGENQWDIALTHPIKLLEFGAKYRVDFKVSSKKDTKIYAKIGDIGEPFREYWNNNWSPITIPANTSVTISQEFIMNSTSDTDEIAFHMGGVLAGGLPNVISFDDITITKK